MQLSPEDIANFHTNTQKTEMNNDKKNDSSVLAKYMHSSRTTLLWLMEFPPVPPPKQAK